MSRMSLNSPISTSNEDGKKVVEKEIGFFEKHKGFVFGVIITIASFFVLTGVAVAVMTYM